MAELAVVQATPPVTAWVVPFVMTRTAVYCCEEPAAIDALAGVTTRACAEGVPPVGSTGPSPTTKGVSGDPVAVQLAWTAWARAATAARSASLWLWVTATVQHL